MADAFEVEEEGSGIVAEEEDVIDDLPVSALDQGCGDRVQVELRELLSEEGLPFLLHEEHEGTVAGRSIEGPKGHDVEGVKPVIGSGKAEFFAVGMADCNLVEAGLGIDTDPEEETGARGKVVDGLVASGNGEAVGEGHGVEAAVVDT